MTHYREQFDSFLFLISQIDLNTNAISYFRAESVQKSVHYTQKLTSPLFAYVSQRLTSTQHTLQVS